MICWDRGRPRPPARRQPRTSLATIFSRFALIAGEGARGPSKSLERNILE